MNNPTNKENIAKMNPLDPEATVQSAPDQPALHRHFKSPSLH